MILMNWEVYHLPFDESFVKNLKPSAVDPDRRGTFFRGVFELKEPARSLTLPT